jgi:hypothetical protein
MINERQGRVGNVSEKKADVLRVPHSPLPVKLCSACVSVRMLYMIKNCFEQFKTGIWNSQTGQRSHGRKQ